MNINEIRKLFSEAADNSSKTNQLYQLLQNETGKNPILLAYRAASEALEAKHSWNVLTKWSNIDKAMQLFQKAIEIAPENIEIRFLRYSIQINTPFILGYSQNINEDKQKMIDLFLEADLPLAMKKQIEKIII